MGQLLSNLGSEDIYIISFLIIALVAFVFMALFFRRMLKKNRDEELQLTEFANRKPLVPPESLASASAAEDLDKVELQATELALAKPLLKEDLPADLPARPIKGIEPEQPAKIHKLEEIQKPERKPLAQALQNTRQSFMGRIKSLFGAKPTLEASELEELEEILYTSDLGPQTVQRLLEAVEARVKSNSASGYEAVRAAIKTEMIDIFAALGATDGAGVQHGSEEYLEGLERLAIWKDQPAVLMIVGVNGAGKTTTIGKVARRLAQSGKRVLVAAGDTFRAAAGDQLKVWTERASVEIFNPEGVQDPSAVAFKACESAINGKFDVVIIDTAGRLHTQKNLMEELKKMKRVVAKLLPQAPHEVLLVLDANSGQNALIQAREFHQALGVTGVVLTKLDGSAKGGVAVGLAHELKIPIKMIGVGEGIDDLRRFSAEEFVDSIL